MENWVSIDGYEGLYEVSDAGMVRSLKRTTTSGRVLSQRAGTGGYLNVCLCKNNRKKTFVVHRLVARAFLDNPEGKPEVNHKNGIRTDNRVENLEWVTRSENERHAYEVLGKSPQAYWKDKPRKFARRFTEEQVLAIRSDKRPYSQIAEDYGVSKTAIRDIKRKKNYREV